jgi:hypothetical protein
MNFFYHFRSARHGRHGKQHGCHRYRAHLCISFLNSTRRIAGDANE